MVVPLQNLVVGAILTVFFWFKCVIGTSWLLWTCRCMCKTGPDFRRGQSGQLPRGPHKYSQTLIHTITITTHTHARNMHSHALTHTQVIYTRERGHAHTHTYIHVHEVVFGNQRCASVTGDMNYTPLFMVCIHMMSPETMQIIQPKKC